MCTEAADSAPWQQDHPSLLEPRSRESWDRMAKGTRRDIDTMARRALLAQASRQPISAFHASHPATANRLSPSGAFERAGRERLRWCGLGRPVRVLCPAEPADHNRRCPKGARSLAGWRVRRVEPDCPPCALVPGARPTRPLPHRRDSRVCGAIPAPPRSCLRRGAEGGSILRGVRVGGWGTDGRPDGRTESGCRAGLVRRSVYCRPAIRGGLRSKVAYAPLGRGAWAAS